MAETTRVKQLNDVLSTDLAGTHVHVEGLAFHIKYDVWFVIRN